MTRTKKWLPIIGIAVIALLLLGIAPAVLSTHWINNLGKYCCLAIAAVGIGLAWGRGGMLVMGQGVFFGLGAYSMAMHLTLETAGPNLPTFMLLYDPLAPLPTFWEPFRNDTFTLAAIVLLPVIVASILGYALFKRRVKGAYFAILTQALAVALAVLISSTIRDTVQDAKVLLLDEPVAGMSQDERTATGELLGRVAVGRAVIVVEHDMDFMRRFATRVTVLHQGLVLSEGSVATVQADPRVQQVYLGTAGAPVAVSNSLTVPDSLAGSTAPDLPITARKEAV